MAKETTKFVCLECGYETSKWMGKCPACGEWNTFNEEVSKKPSSSIRNITSLKSVNLDSVEKLNEIRYSTGISELDRVLGGGAVKGSLILIGGDPGIGKSTLILQICNTINKDLGILYVSGEESVQQIKMRADRLGVKNSRLSMLAETSFGNVEELIKNENPRLVIIDSIQTMYSEELSSAPGSVSQVREATSRLMRLAKSMDITIIIIGHVTKEGAIAGPRVLEHMVDTVLYFEGERHMTYRILRAVKNRFGSTNEIGIFEMQDRGLVEVGNPSEILLGGRPEEAPGSVVIAGMEGTRPMLIEIQALVCSTNLGMPRRMSTGIDHNRITLLMAVLEKRAGMLMYNYDAYVNVAGGIKIVEPASDLGIIMALASSFKNAAIEKDTVVIGEVGLTGEVRAISHIDKRIAEAARLGFKKGIIPEGNKKSISQLKGIDKLEITYINNIKQAIDCLF